MNKNYIIVLFILIFINSNSYSQIVIDKTDMPSEGKYYIISNNITLNDSDYTKTGADYYWDFSSLTPATQSIDSFVSVGSTPAVFQFVYNSNFDPAHKATVAQPQNTLDLIPSVNLSNVFTFYRLTDNLFSIVGYGAYLNSIPLPIRYESPDILYKLPLIYGNIDSNTAVIELSIPNTGYFSQVKKRKNIVDGWGTVTTPFGTFQVLRVQTLISEKDSVHLDTLSINPPAISRNYTIYSWLVKSYAVPILQVTDNGLSLTVAYLDSITTNINEGAFINPDIRLFPNPASSRICIRFYIDKPISVEISILDLVGSRELRVGKWEHGVGSKELKVDISKYHLNKGIYFVKIKTNNTTAIKKLVIN